MRIRSRLIVTVATIGLAAGALVAVGPARATAPGYFPQGFGLASTAFTLRFAGADRFATAGTGAMVAAVNQETKSGWPFDEGNPFDPAKAYGAKACPSTVFIVASDGLPDALAASSLRGIASLTLPGSSHAFDTSNALLLLTDTARPPVNATSLNGTTKTTLTALKTACPSGFDAIILGGTAAVPSGAETDLNAYAGTVGRIAGLDRFDTAGRIASLVAGGLGLGTVAYHSSSSDKAGTSEKSTVFLAEGMTGADALAVGPIAAATHAPILLATSTGLPVATSTALSSLKPANIIVLGGTVALPDAVVGAAKGAAATSNAPIRIFGPTRYATSVALAENLDNIWPANATDSFQQDAATFSNQLFGFARSEGTGDNHVGWPDALSSALVLNSMNQSATAPVRLAPPVEANDGKTTLGGTASPFRAPLLLVSQASVPPEVNSFLSGLYPSGVPHNTIDPNFPPPNGVTDLGGFGFVFGGSAAVAPGVELTIAQDLSGGAYTAGAPRTDLSPAITLAKTFYTAADFTNYKETSAGIGGVASSSAFAAGAKICTSRGADTGVQWLDVLTSSGTLSGAPGQAVYEPPNSSYPAGKNEIFCVAASGAPGSVADLFGVSLSGGLSNFIPVDWSNPAHLVSTSSPGVAPPASAIYNPSSPTSSIDSPASPTGPTTLTLTYTNVPITLVVGGQTYSQANSKTNLTIVLTRTQAPTPSQPPQPSDNITCTGTMVVTNNSGGTVLSASLNAEASSVPANPPPPVPPSPAPIPIPCAGEYTNGTATGGVHFTITGGSTSNPSDGPANLSDLVLDGNI